MQTEERGRLSPQEAIHSPLSTLHYQKPCPPSPTTAPIPSPSPSSVAPAIQRTRTRWTGCPRWPRTLGEDVLPHVVTFQGLLRNVARCYYPSDEAIRDSWDNARFMRNDPGIMECLEQRKRSTALLGWHLEAEDEKDPTQKMLVEELTAILKTLPNFLKYRENLLDALWYGKYAVAHRYRWKKVRGQMRVVVDKWRPVNGDKLVFRYDDGTGSSTRTRWESAWPGLHRGSQVAKRWMIERIGQVAATDQGLAYFLEHWDGRVGDPQAPDRGRRLEAPSWPARSTAWGSARGSTGCGTRSRKRSPG